MKLFCFLVGVTGVLSSSSIACAQSASRTALAIQLFDDGQKLMASGDAAAACPKYAESQNLDPQLGTLLHLAACYEKIGKTASAWSDFKDAVELAAMRRDPRERAARAELEKLEPRLTKVVFVVSASPPAGLVIRQDGVAVPRAAWSSPVPVDPGSHEIRAEAPEFRAWVSTVEIPASATPVRVEVPELDPISVASVSPSPPRREQAPPAAPRSAPRANSVGSSSSPHVLRASRNTTRTALELVCGGVALAGVTTGVVFEVQRNSKLSDRAAVCGNDYVCPRSDPEAPARIEQLTHEARSASTWSTVGFIAGGAGVLGALALLVTAPSHSERPVQLAFTPFVGVASAGAALGGSW